MAFNFKWMPLAADASFYSRAKDLLTAALNKSPKPPIIVDDILVDELNLGSLPPDLEVLEIGDLDVDRFRGIFKMSYAGNAYLTLRTKVQGNPLNTFLSSRPKFCSPEPLAAASGLTIPILITLSEIRLSAFIILVYSTQKGLTLVFRNDPLESLKVSSTFDGIPFVREYLQKEIEKQLRVLLMDELPLIIHRLSLRLFSKDEAEADKAAAETTSGGTRHSTADGAKETGAGEIPIDPLASPPQDPVDKTGNVLDASQIASLSLDPGAEMHALFSRKNLLRLDTLTNSHRTLSLFTPTIQDAVFRVWAFSDRSITSGKDTPAHMQPQRHDTKYILTSPTSADSHFHSSRQLLCSRTSSRTGGKTYRRKKKHRVVNLRKKPADGAAGDDMESLSGESSTTGTTGSLSAPSSADGPSYLSSPTYMRTTGVPSSPLEHMPTLKEQQPVRPRTPEPADPGDTAWGQTPPHMKRPSSSSHLTSSMTADDDTPRQSQYLNHPASDHRTIRPIRSRPGLLQQLSSDLYDPAAAAAGRRASATSQNIQQGSSSSTAVPLSLPARSPLRKASQPASPSTVAEKGGERHSSGLLASPSFESRPRQASRSLTVRPDPVPPAEAPETASKTADHESLTGVKRDSIVESSSSRMTTPLMMPGALQPTLSMSNEQQQQQKQQDQTEEPAWLSDIAGQILRKVHQQHHQVQQQQQQQHKKPDVSSEGRSGPSEGMAEDDPPPAYRA